MAIAPDSVRTFIAVSLNPGLRAGLKRIQETFQAELPGPSVRWVKPEQLHLTLKFLGNVAKDSLNDLAAAVRRAAAGVAPMRLALEGAGCFPDTKSPRVVWVGIHGELDSLRRLQAQIEQETKAFAGQTEARGFQPHLTIGRVATRGREARQVGELIERAAVSRLGEWTVQHIDLVQSELSPEGPRYTTLAAVALTG